MELCNVCRLPLGERIGRCVACSEEHGCEGFKQPETHYGAFQGGDPRCFTPDPEACTPREHAAWEAACDLAARDPACRDLPPAGSVHVMLYKGRLIAGFSERIAFGLGVTHVTG